MRCTKPCFAHEHRQGRCECGTNATRAALGMPPLPEQSDEPPASMDAIEPAIWIVIFASLIAIVIGIASAIGMYLPN